MRTFLVAAAATMLLAGIPGRATADDFVPPPCADPDVATLAAAAPECTGDDPVPSVDPAEAADPPTHEALAARAAAVEASMPSPAELPRYCRQHVNAYFYTSSDWLRLGERLLA